MTENRKFLSVVTYVCRLLYLFCRFAYRNLHFHWFVENIACKSLNLVGHGGREHDGLSVGGQSLYDSHDVVIESHVEHAVGLVEYEETDTAEIDVAHTYMTEKTSRRCNDHVGTHSQTAHLLVVARTVVAAIYSHTADAIEIVTKALHSLVNLLCQLTCG